MKTKSKKKSNLIYSNELNIFNLFEEAFKSKKLIFIITLFSLILSSIIFFTQKSNFSVNLNLQNVPKASFYSFNIPKSIEALNINFSFDDEMYSELINMVKNDNAQIKNLTNFSIKIGREEDGFIRINLGSSNKKALLEYVNFIMNYSNKKLNDRLHSNIMNKITYIENRIMEQNKKLDLLSEKNLELIKSDNVFSELIYKKIQLDNIKTEYFYALQEYKDLLVKVEQGIFVNYNAINHDSSINIIDNKFKYYFIIIITLLGFIIGIFLSLLLVLRNRSIR